LPALISRSASSRFCDCIIFSRRWALVGLFFCGPRPRRMATLFFFTFLEREREASTKRDRKAFLKWDLSALQRNGFRFSLPTQAMRRVDWLGDYVIELRTLISHRRWRRGGPPDDATHRSCMRSHDVCPICVGAQLISLDPTRERRALR
jgi:hypothetical protein